MRASATAMNELKEKTCMRRLLTLAACGVLALGVVACGDDDDSSDSSGSGGGGGNLSGDVAIDGSSTVAPFAQAARRRSRARTRT